MTFFIAFLVVGILLGLYVMRLFTVKQNRKDQQKKSNWDKQYKDLMEMFKKRLK